MSLSDNYGAMSSWGGCEMPNYVDTVLFRKLQTPRAGRGPLPVRHLYDCSNTTDECHSIDLREGSDIVEQPIPVTLSKLQASPRVARFDSIAYATVLFTASRTPATITIGGGTYPQPMTITFWQWIGADTTRLPVTGYCNFPSAALTCTFYPREAGRMVVKAFVGGWEQTSSVSVQCFMHPADFIVNDTTNDFSARAELLDALSLSNPDSTSLAGWDASNPKGWKNEAPGILWKLPNGGGYQFVPYDDPSGNACKSSLPPSAYDPSAAPVPGAVPAAGVHSHSSLPGGNVYGCDSVDDRGVRVPAAQRPGDGRPTVRAPYEDEVAAGSNDDWTWVHNSSGLPMFIMTARGFVIRLDDPMNGQLRGPHKAWRATRGIARDDPSAGKCSWVKKYKA